MVRLRATGKMGYGTRRMLACDESGVFDLKDRTMGRAMVALKMAEPVAGEPAKRRGRPPKSEAAPSDPTERAAPSGGESGYDDMTRSELLDLAEQRGIELPAGYASRDTLINILRGSPVED